MLSTRLTEHLSETLRSPRRGLVVAMMDLSLRKEQFSQAYVRAVAAVAGYGVSKPDPDYDSIDIELSGRTGEGVPTRPKIDIQLKCTSQNVPRDRDVVYPLKRKNYDELRMTDLLVPRLLIVVHIPESEEEWLEHSEAELVLRRCGYWVPLKGQPEVANTTTVSVALPRTNIF